MLKTTTNNEGTFVFPSLAPTVYDISVNHAGFATYTRKRRAGQRGCRSDDQRHPQDGKYERVAGGRSLSEIHTGGRHDGHSVQVIGPSQVNDLPLNGRNASALTEEVAGITIAPPAQADQGNTKTFPMVVAISANGTFVGQTNYMLDGGNNVDEYTNVNEPFPMPDALQEFSVETSNYNAQYGQNAGGVVNIITKHGTNQYHGDLFEFVRNRAFNAANAFTYSTALGPRSSTRSSATSLAARSVARWRFPTCSTATSRSGSLDISGRSTMRLRRLLHPSADNCPSGRELVRRMRRGRNNLVFAECVSNPLDIHGANAVTDPTCPSQTPYVTSHTWKPAALSSVTANFLKYVPPLTHKRLRSLPGA